MSVPKVGMRQSPEEVGGIPVLARGTLPGGGKFVIFLEPYKANKSKSIEYSLMLGKAEPVNYEPPNSPRRFVHKGMVWGKTGGDMVVGYEGGGTVMMTIIDGCTGPYPDRVAWGLLKARRDIVMAYTDGRVIRFRTAALPRHLDAAGVVIYALLPPRANGQIITRAPDGGVVYKESLPKSSEGKKC
ncbi:MAG TPA: hypothetical protein VGP17_06670 [Solirubrobacteraceae bacterium]|nr:hypothetical protein [Solirubrobacteraceae bacterium]